MLANQQFIDPQVATQIHKLQLQMKKLIQTKINIQNNDKIKQQTKIKLLKYNEDERVKLRKVMQKCKLSMVEYLDKQVQVISKECVMNGEKVYVENNNNINNVSLSLQLSQHQHSEKDNNNKSIVSTSTHCRTNSRHSNKFQFNQSFRLMNSTNNLNSSSQIMQIAEFNLTSNNLTDKLFNNNKTYNRKIFNNRNNSNPFVIQSSPLLYESNRRHKDKDKQREKLKLTTYLQNQPQSFINQNNKQYQQEQHQDNQQQDQQMIAQLYTRKIHCLQQKCLYLKQQNMQLQKVIHYQQQTIQQITQMLDQKQKQIQQLQRVNKNKKSYSNNNNNNNNNNSFYEYQQRVNQLQTVIGYIFYQIKSKLKQYGVDCSWKRLVKQLEELQSTYMNKNQLFQQIKNKHNQVNKISPSSSAFSKINHKYSQYQPIIISHLPQLTPPIHQFNNNNPYIPSYQSSKLHHHQQQSLILSSSSSIYNQNHLQQQQSSTTTKNELDILTLTNKLLQLQQTLKSIKLENQQLRAERSLLLKKIKIT